MRDPANTWVSAKNIGTEPISLTFIFSVPGFEDTMRCNSVPAGETPTQITNLGCDNGEFLAHLRLAKPAWDPYPMRVWPVVQKLPVPEAAL